MIESIRHALQEAGISVYLIRETKTERVELYFIKKKLDMRRRVETERHQVVVYRDFEEAGESYRGSATVLLQDGMEPEEMIRQLKQAYYAASFARNRWYPLAGGTRIEEVKQLETNLSEDCEKNAEQVAAAVFAADTEQTVFLNTLEVFSSCEHARIVNSEGVDVSYRKFFVNGEFVAQCLEPQDVETYEDFCYDTWEEQELQEKVRRVLKLTKDRAAAVKAPEAGEYTVILSGKYVPTILGYYRLRSEASMVYQGYSRYKIGEDVQMAGEETSVKGERLNLWLLATEPYSEEGIAMKDRCLLEDGKLKTYFGGCRFSHYLGTEPTGSYSKIKVKEGTTPFAEMKTGSYLHVVNFSDFQMDSLTGSFAGEIRLAYLCDGTKVTPVTGGSINGMIGIAQKNFTFSKETQSGTKFCGPYAIRLEHVQVAGSTAK